MILTEVSKAYDKEFVLSLRSTIKAQFIVQLDYKKLQAVEDDIKFVFDLKDDFDLLDICINSIDTSILVESETSYIIEVNPVIRVNNLRLFNLINLINDGSLDIDAYPIFSEIKKYIENNIDYLYELYQLGINI